MNSTLACALVASKLGVKIAHVEAGLRSFDRTMPEEVNRVLTDHLSDLLFTTEESAKQNLANEGIEPEWVRFVANTMIDTLVRLLPAAGRRNASLRHSERQPKESPRHGEKQPRWWSKEPRRSRSRALRGVSRPGAKTTRVE